MHSYGCRVMHRASGCTVVRAGGKGLRGPPPRCLTCPRDGVHTKKEFRTGDTCQRTAPSTHNATAPQQPQTPLPQGLPRFAPDLTAR